MSSDEMNPDDPTAADLAKAGILEETEGRLGAEFDRSRTSETQAINEFEKMLWLTNSGAATVTIGYITTTDNPGLMQFIGSCSFVLAIISMLTMRFVAERVTTRDRARRRKASERFLTEDVPMSILGAIRDVKFKRLAKAYKTLKTTAAVLFVVGCVLTLYGILPNIEFAHNNGVQPNAEASADP